MLIFRPVRTPGERNSGAPLARIAVATSSSTVPGLVLTTATRARLVAGGAAAREISGAMAMEPRGRALDGSLARRGASTRRHRRPSPVGGKVFPAASSEVEQ